MLAVVDQGRDEDVGLACYAENSFRLFDGYSCCSRLHGIQKRHLTERSIWNLVLPRGLPLRQARLLLFLKSPRRNVTQRSIALRLPQGVHASLQLLKEGNHEVLTSLSKKYTKSYVDNSNDIICIRLRGSGIIATFEGHPARQKVRGSTVLLTDPYMLFSELAHRGTAGCRRGAAAME